MNTCPATRRRPFDDDWARCGLPPSHPDSHLARYVNHDGQPCWMRWKA